MNRPLPLQESVKVNENWPRLGVPHADGLDHPELPVVWRNSKTQLVESNLITKKTWLVRMRWLHHQPSMQPPVNARAGDWAKILAGGRAYKFKSGENSVVHPLHGVVTKQAVVSQMVMGVGIRQLDGHYWTTERLHAHVMRDGGELLP